MIKGLNDFNENHYTTHCSMSKHRHVLYALKMVDDVKT